MTKINSTGGGHPFVPSQPETPPSTSTVPSRRSNPNQSTDGQPPDRRRRIAPPLPSPTSQADGQVSPKQLMEQAGLSAGLTQFHLERWPRMSEEARSSLRATLNRIVLLKQQTSGVNPQATSTVVPSTVPFSVHRANADARQTHARVAADNDALIADFCKRTTERKSALVKGVTNWLTRKGIGLASLLPPPSTSDPWSTQPAPDLEAAIHDAVGEPGVLDKASRYIDAFNEAFCLAIPTDKTVSNPEVAQLNSTLIAGYCANATAGRGYLVTRFTNDLSRQGIMLASLLPPPSISGSSGTSQPQSAPLLEAAIDSAVGHGCGVGQGKASACKGAFNEAFGLAMPTDNTAGGPQGIGKRRVATRSATREAKQTQRQLAQANANTVTQRGAMPMTKVDRNLVMGFVNWATRNGKTLADLLPSGGDGQQAAPLLKAELENAHGQPGMMLGKSATSHIRAFNRVFNLSMQVPASTPQAARGPMAAVPSTTSPSSSISTTTSTATTKTAATATTAPTTAAQQQPVTTASSEDDPAEIELPDFGAIEQEHRSVMDEVCENLSSSDREHVRSFFSTLQGLPWSTLEPQEDDVTPFALEEAVNSAIAGGCDPQIRGAMSRALGITLEDALHDDS